MNHWPNEISVWRLRLGLWFFFWCYHSTPWVYISTFCCLLLGSDRVFGHRNDT